MTINNIVLITWANGWLGQSLVSNFLDKGYFVFAWVKNVEWKEQQHSHLKYLLLDITKLEDIIQCKAEIDKIGKIKVLINNAWISWWWSFWNREISVEKSIFEVNLWGTINMVKHFWSDLEQNNGIIVNIWSISWAVPTPFISTYSASKSALEKIMLGIYLEKLNPKVRILHLNLGPLDQGMCWNSIKEESERYTEKIRKHMMKIQRIHWYHVDNVSRYILQFIHSRNAYKIKTLWIWSIVISILSYFIRQPNYQKLIWKIYKSI